MNTKILILQEGGNICDKDVTLTSAMVKKGPTNLFTTAFCKKNITNLGSGKMFQGKGWSYQGNRFIPVGYKAPSEDINPNSHVLPGDDSNPYFGDILVYALDKSSNLTNITEELYEEFYATSFEDDGITSEEEVFELNEEEQVSDTEEKMDYGEEEIEEIEEIEEENIGDEESYIKNLGLESTDVIVEEEDEIDNDVVIKDILEDSEYSIQVRNQIVSKFKGFLDNEKLSSSIEEAIIQFSKEKAERERIPRNWENMLFRKIYLNKARSLYTNLNTDSYVKNPNFKQKIVEGKIKPSDIPNLTFQQVFPEHWKKLMDEKYKKEKLLYEEKPEAMTTQYKCGRCKSRKCTYYELQTRSADESMTIFITCINCGNRWKQ
jgi:DNA-directed RNA polymerase subunit M/transcription elongation factor TFIIS